MKFKNKRIKNRRITELSVKVIPPVYHCTRVRQFPAWLLVLGTGPIIIPRTRVYILIAVVPKHFVVSRSKGLSPLVAITSVTKSATAGSGRAPSRLETFAPRLCEGMRDSIAHHRFRSNTTTLCGSSAI